MYKINKIVFFSFFVFLFCSCNGQMGTNATNCNKKFKEARNLVFTYPAASRQTALDSALNLANECLLCDSIKKAVIDFKITLLIAMKKYAEGINFVSSLSDSDFSFGFKKKITLEGIQALVYGSKNDTINRNLTYKEMASYLERYLQLQHISDNEFKEIYTYLFAIRENYLDSVSINKEVDSLQKVYPAKESFFEFFRKHQQSQ